MVQLHSIDPSLGWPTGLVDETLLPFCNQTPTMSLQNLNNGRLDEQKFIWTQYGYVWISGTWALHSGTWKKSVKFFLLFFFQCKNLNCHIFRYENDKNVTLTIAISFSLFGWSYVVCLTPSEITPFYFVWLVVSMVGYMFISGCMVTFPPSIVVNCSWELFLLP